MFMLQFDNPHMYKTYKLWTIHAHAYSFSRYIRDSMRYEFSAISGLLLELHGGLQIEIAKLNVR